MSDAARVALAALLAFGLVTAAVFAGHDGTTFTAPPEAVAESFVRQLVDERDELAMRYVDPQGGISIAAVRAGGAALRQCAPAVVANDVEGRPGTIVGDRATATAQVRGRGAGVDVELLFVRRAGVWRVSDWRLVRR